MSKAAREAFRNDIVLKLNSKQELALTLPTRRLLLSGGIRAGKTTAALMKVKEIATRMPGSQILIVRKTLKEIRDDIFKSVYNPTDGILSNATLYGTLNKSNYEHFFPNGSKILYRQADDSKKLLGLDLSCIYMEQAENIDKDFFEHALGRLTHWGDSNNPQSRGYRYIQKFGTGEYASSIAKRPSHFMILSVNPDTGSWIYDDIIRTCKNYTPFTPHIKHQDLNWDIVNFQTTDNAQLPDVEKYVDEIKASTSENYYRRMILGEWIGSEGMVFSHFLTKHIISDWTYYNHGTEKGSASAGGSKDGPKRYEIVVGIDPGSAWYTGIVFGAYDKKMDTYVIFDEIKVRDMIIPEICAIIKEKLKTYSIDIENAQFVIDSAAHAKESNGISKADQYVANGIFVTNASKILEGALERMNGLFKQNRIAITGNCSGLLNDIKSYKYDKNGKPDKGVGSRAFDLTDAFRYIMNKYTYGSDYKETKVRSNDPVIRTQEYLTKVMFEMEPEEKDNKTWGI